MSEFIKEFWENQAKKYKGSHMASWGDTNALKLEFDLISKYICSGHKVLDVGCSGGQFLNSFDPDKWIRLGVDIEQHDAEFAKKEFGIDVRVGHILELDWNEKFDLVMMRGVIEHVSNPITFIEKCCDLILPGGIFYITATPMGDSFAFYVYREKWILFL